MKILTSLVVFVAFLFTITENLEQHRKIRELEATVAALTVTNAELEARCPAFTVKDAMRALNRPYSARARYLVSLSDEEWEAEVERCEIADCTGY